MPIELVWRRSRFALLVAALALIASACSGSGTAAAAADPADTTLDAECFLGLDLWDTDPALTWIEDGRVWVRAGGRQACLAFTEASDLWWSPDGRRLFLDDDIVEGDTVLATLDTGDAGQVVWQQPFGNAVHSVGADGATSSVNVGAAEPAAALPSTGAVLLASHPDGEHFATVDASGSVSLAASTTGQAAEILALEPGQRPVQIDFSPDGSRIWLLVDGDTDSRAIYIDLVPVSAFLDIPPVDSIVPVEEPLVPPPDLYYLDVDLAPSALYLEVGVGASGADATRLALHPSHFDWVVLTEGSCSDATSSLFIDGVAAGGSMPGAAVGFFRGGGLPILATTSAGDGCGQGQLWVTSGLPIAGSTVLVADNVSAADIRDEAPDPWNPNSAPPFA